MVKAKRSVQRGILGCHFDECLSVLQSSPHSPSLMNPFHSSAMSCVWSMSSFSKLTSPSHPNALRLAPPQRSRLLVTAEQCANQLAHDKCVYALGRVRPNSLCSGTGAFLPCNWIRSSKRCTKLCHGKIQRHKFRKFKHRPLNSEMFKIRNTDEQRTQTKGRHGRSYNHEQHRQVTALRMCRGRYIAMKEKGNRYALNVLKVSGKTCCSRNQVLDSVVEYFQEERKVLKPNRKKMRRNERKQSYKKLQNGKVLEFRMSKEEKRIHRKAQKNLQSHTQRSLSKVIKNMHNKRNAKNQKKITGIKCTNRNVQKRMSPVKTCSVTVNKNDAVKKPNESNVLKTLGMNKAQPWEDTCDKQCWLCEQETGACQRIVKCESCNITYHIDCMGFSSIEHLLTNKSVAWICRKCGKCTYSQSLLYELGIPTDENMFAMPQSELEVQDESTKKSTGKDSFVLDDTTDNCINEIVQEIITAVKTLKEEVC